MIVLRPATMDDRDILLQWRNDLSVEKEFWFTAGAVTMREHEAWLAQWIARMYIDTKKSEDKPREGLFMAEVHQSGVSLVGSGRITMNMQHRANSACLIHYMIAPDRRKKGWGTQLVHALVHKAHDEMGYAVVGAEIHRQNEASFKCALMGGVHSIGVL